MIYSYAAAGFSGQLIHVECSIRRGMPNTEIVGLPDGAVKEARERVRTVLLYCGFLYPNDRILINLAPAGVKKTGAGFDLPIALAILLQDNQLAEVELPPLLVLGELELSGRVRSSEGVLAAVASAYELGIQHFLVPQENLAEAESLAASPKSSRKSSAGPQTASQKNPVIYPIIYPLAHITELRVIIDQAIAEHGNEVDLNFIDTSLITDMSELFFIDETPDEDTSSNKYKDFNGNISNWDTSKVTTMQGMLAGATTFNQPIGNWDTSQVTTMEWMFYYVHAFNQPIGNWNTSKVTTMEGMFAAATAFNQPIGNWDTSKVTKMEAMFFSAIAFNQPIDNWDTSQMSNMSYMFAGATAFNQPIGDWDTSKVTKMEDMFEGATKMNANPSNKPKRFR